MKTDASPPRTRVIMDIVVDADGVPDRSRPSILHPMARLRPNLDQPISTQTEPRTLGHVYVSTIFRIQESPSTSQPLR
jgi:hypothetical protein